MRKKSIIVGNIDYSARSFATKYNFSYQKVLQLYNNGFRDESLLDELQMDFKKKRGKTHDKGLVIGDNKFRSKNEAANYYGIPRTTFYRYAKLGKLDYVIKKKELKDKFL